MNGTIEIDSEPGEGTAIKILFTFFRAQEKADSGNVKNFPAVTDLSGMRILLAENNALNREIALVILEEKGAEVTCAVNGKEALDCFAESPEGFYDVILMDIMMPVMDGLQATRKIRTLKRPDAQAIPVFAMTANAFQEDIQKSREAGITAHFSKPLDYEMLVRKIREMNRVTGV